MVENIMEKQVNYKGLSDVVVINKVDAFYVLTLKSNGEVLVEYNVNEAQWDDDEWASECDEQFRWYVDDKLEEQAKERAMETLRTCGAEKIYKLLYDMCGQCDGTAQQWIAEIENY